MIVDNRPLAGGVGTWPVAGEARFVRVFDFDVENTTLGDASRWIVERAQHGRKTDIAFLNAHCINVAQRDRAYADAVRDMDRLFGDGIGIAMAARAAGVPLVDNVNGTDLFPVLCRDAATSGVSVFLFGARDGVAKGAADRMVRDNPALTIAGTAHGYLTAAEDEDRLVAEINASGAGVLLVALGVPQQELWIAKNRHRLTVPVVIGVGGLFDYYAGRIQRAPMIVRRMRSEWVWRLAMEPRRLAKRYLFGNAEFLARLAWQRLTRPTAFRPATLLKTQ